jgi:hypothetical protein
MAHATDPGVVADLPADSDALGLLIVGPTGNARHVFAEFGPRGGVSLTPGFRVRLSPPVPGPSNPVSAQFAAPPLPDTALASLPLPARAVLTSLGDAPTFTTLTELVDMHGGSDPWVLPALDDDLDAVATVLCRVADGWLLVPARGSDPDAGWEQLDPAAAVLLPDVPDVPRVLAQWAAATAAVRETLLRVLDAAAPVPADPAPAC